MSRKIPLATGEIYHIFNRSIATFQILNNNSEYSRMLAAMRYYQIEKPPISFSKFYNRKLVDNKDSDKFLNKYILDRNKLIEIVAYCIMPTHVHFILKQLKDDGISTVMSNLQNSYTRYFNTLHRRKGPLWEGRFRNVIVETDEQLLHLTRYIHLNPVSARLIDKPEHWYASSYNEYILRVNDNCRICKYEDILNIHPDFYKEFVEDRLSYQKELQKIKHLIIE